MSPKLNVHGRAAAVIALALAVPLLVVLSACAPVTAQAASQASGQPTATPEPALHVHFLVDMFQFTAPEQFCQTLVTAEVVVGAHGAARWNTVDGKRPAGVLTEDEVVAQNYRIYTPVTFARFVPLIDHRHVATKEFLTIGGQVGQDTYEADELPTLPGTGGHYIVVFSPATPHTGGNTEASLVVGWAYPVDAQGMVVLQQAGNPNEPGPGSPSPPILIALASLKQRLAACKP